MKTKKWLSALLTVMLILGMIPMTVLASENQPQVISKMEAPVITASGTSVTQTNNDIKVTEGNTVTLTAVLPEDVSSHTLQWYRKGAQENEFQSIPEAIDTVLTIPAEEITTTNTNVQYICTVIYIDSDTKTSEPVTLTVTDNPTQQWDPQADSYSVPVKYMGYPKKSVNSNAGIPLPMTVEESVLVSSESDCEVDISEYPSKVSDGNITYERKGILVAGSEDLEYKDTLIIPRYPAEGVDWDEWNRKWGDGITIIYQEQDGSGAISLDTGSARISLTPYEGTTLPEGTRLKSEDYELSMGDIVKIINGAPDLGLEVQKADWVIDPDSINTLTKSAEIPTDNGYTTVMVGDIVAIEGKEYVVHTILFEEDKEVRLAGIDGMGSIEFTRETPWTIVMRRYYESNGYQSTRRLVRVGGVEYIEGGTININGKTSFLYKDGKPAGVIIFYPNGDIIAHFREGYAPDDLKDKLEDPGHLVLDTSGGLKCVDILFSQNITAVDGSGDEAKVDRSYLSADLTFAYSGRDVLKHDYISAHISEHGIEYGETKVTASGVSGTYDIRSDFDIKNGFSPFITLAVSDYEIPVKKLKLPANLQIPENPQPPQTTPMSPQTPNQPQTTPIKPQSTPVASQTKNKTTPKTGDTSNTLLWMAMLGGSALCILTLIWVAPYRKSKN